MKIQTPTELTNKRCVPCEGGVEPCTLSFVADQLKSLDGWKLTDDKLKISKSWKMKNFVDALAFCNKAGEVAEAEAHHPDLHLENYRDLTIVIWTHAIGGLSENDFILAAKIDQIN